MPFVTLRRRWLTRQQLRKIMSKRSAKSASPAVRAPCDSPKGVCFRWAFWIIVAGLTTFLVYSLCSCSHLTLAPKQVSAHAIAFDENSQNAGIIDCGKNGCIVTKNWVAKYRQMESEFKQSLAADSGIATEGDNYRISYEILEHFLDLKAAERGP